MKQLDAKQHAGHQKEEINKAEILQSYGCSHTSTQKRN
jgi:hypothetical protein